MNWLATLLAPLLTDILYQFLKRYRDDQEFQYAVDRAVDLTGSSKPEERRDGRKAIQALIRSPR